MILLKTENGQRVFKDRSVRLTPRQRSAFILFDGKRSVDEVLASGMGIVPADIAQMVEWGLLGPDAVLAANDERADVEALPIAAVAPVVSLPAVPTLPAQQRYKDAYPIATQLTGALGLRGFRLNLAVEGTGSYEELLALAPRIRAAVGPEKAAALERALGL